MINFKKTECFGIFFLVLFLCIFLLTEIFNHKHKLNALLNINTVGKNENYPIDLVYLWCEENSNKKKTRHELMKKFGTLKNVDTNNKEQTTESRFISSDELKYSLRSVEKYAPWINKIYIVTDNQVPKWLNLKHPKIKIIDHKDIIPSTARPNFNSNAIEHCIVNIKGLNEHFLYANDDMMFFGKVEPGDFFKDGKPIYIFNGKLMPNKVDSYKTTLIGSYDRMKEKFGFYYFDLQRYPHHNIDPYTKTNIFNCQKDFKQDVEETINSHFRSSKNLQRNIYTLHSIYKNAAYYKIQKRTFFDFIFGKYKQISNMFGMHKIDNLHIKPGSMKMLCINDNEYTTDFNRSKYKSMMEELFPEKSSFEK